MAQRTRRRARRRLDHQRRLRPLLRRRHWRWGYVPTELASPDTTGFEIEIIGKRRPARLQLEPLLDPAGTRMRPPDWVTIEKFLMTEQWNSPDQCR